MNADYLRDILRQVRMRKMMLNETTTLGVREHLVQRHVLARDLIPLQTEFGEIRVKVAHRPDGTRTANRQYEDCVRSARANEVLIARVVAAVQRQASEWLEQGQASRPRP
jgi:pyridinium-3,5-bisthiocarboxylic acid mononucleotide nickel chelatase